MFSFFTGFEFAKARLFDQFMSYDARACGTRFEIPFFVFQGESDVLTVTSLARDYFADVDAPVKELVLISDAGHFAAFTRPGQFLAALVQHVRPLAVPEYQGS